jgi:hypothetical protein
MGRRRTETRMQQTQAGARCCSGLNSPCADHALSMRSRGFGQHLPYGPASSFAISLFAKGERGKDFPAPVAKVTTESPLWDDVPSPHNFPSSCSRSQDRPRSESGADDAGRHREDSQEIPRGSRDHLVRGAGLFSYPSRSRGTCHIAGPPPENHLRRNALLRHHQGAMPLHKRVATVPLAEVAS